MKVKPKEVLLNLPVALLFDQPWEVANFAANVNAILHGKVRLKAEELGSLGGSWVGLFYLQRNNESQEIHDEFVRLIESELITEHEQSSPSEGPEDCECGKRAYDFCRFCNKCIKCYCKCDGTEHRLCLDCDELNMLHQKGLDHCVCGDDWDQVHSQCISQDERE